MSFYDERVLPHLINWSMRQPIFDAYRRRVLQAAEGCVLEIGIGAGLNLPFYGHAAEHVIGLEPSPRLLAMVRETSSAVPRQVELLRATAEAIPLEDGCVDTVVSTWTLCSIPDVARALEEIRRVLKTDGRFVFVEHGLSSDPGVSRWQHRLTPLWKRIAGGCHLDRPIARLVENAGFRFDQLQTEYMQGPRPMTFMYAGSARIGITRSFHQSVHCGGT